MATIAQMSKLRVIKKSVALGLYRMEVVKFTGNTYWSLSDHALIMSSSDKKEMVCIKGNLLIAQQGKFSGESSGRANL